MAIYMMATSSEDSGSASGASRGVPQAKRAKRQCHFLPQWIHEFKWIGKSGRGKRLKETQHIGTNRHKELAKSATSKPVTSFFRSDISDSTIRAEAMWFMFVAKHNLAFLTSDHANRMFREMFPDSTIAK